MPSMLSVVLLWYFEVLNRGGPLIIVLLVPALGWYVTQLIKISHSRRETGQVGTSSDPPPKYEKVMAEPPPYSALYSEKPPAKASIASTKPATISDKLRPAYRFCDPVATISLDNTHFFPPEPSHHRISTSDSSVEVENEPLLDNTFLESGVAISVVAVDEKHDPDLPSYQDAVRTAAALP